MLFRQQKLLLGILAIVLLNPCNSSCVKPTISPVLSRDVDQRPLSEVKLLSLSAKMQAAVRGLAEKAKRDAGLPKDLDVTIHQIPVAPPDHRLYLVELSGEGACARAGENCTLAVFDEAQDKVITVVNGQFADLLVVRRPHLQMPDIGARYALGRDSGNYMTVYRFFDGWWALYACKKTSTDGEDDPHPEFLADATCN